MATWWGKVMSTPCQTSKVLVVDDEPAILHLVSTALSVRGYEVHATPSPWEAWDIVKSTSCFDLVLSDVIMPQISGPELITKIREICPTIAVILMSGHIAEEVLPEDVGFIRKPFRISDLCSVVEKKLMADASPKHWES